VPGVDLFMVFPGGKITETLETLIE